MASRYGGPLLSRVDRRSSAPIELEQLIAKEYWYCDFNDRNDYNWAAHECTATPTVAPVFDRTYPNSNVPGSYCTHDPGTAVGSGLQYVADSASLPTSPLATYNFGFFTRFRVTDHTRLVTFIGIAEDAGTSQVAIPSAAGYGLSCIGVRVNNTGVVEWQHSGTVGPQTGNADTIGVPYVNGTVLDFEMRGFVRCGPAIGDLRSGYISAYLNGVKVGRSTLRIENPQTAPPISQGFGVTGNAFAPVMTVLRTGAGAAELQVDIVAIWNDRQPR